MIVGGLRRRVIKDNFYYMVYKGLEDLGWFSSTQTLSENSVTLIAEQIDPQTEIKPNKVGIAFEDMDAQNMEMGSNLQEYRWTGFLDIFAEDEATGVHLSGDIYDILTGKMASIGRTGPVLEVYDLNADGEPHLFNCEIDNVELARVREWERPYNKYWWVVGLDLLDTYYGEGG